MAFPSKDQENQERAQIPTGEMMAAIFITLLIGVGETTLLLSISSKGKGLSLYALLHLGLSGLLGLWVYSNSRTERDLKFPLLTLLFFFMYGPLGAAISFAVMVFYLFFSRNAMPFIEWLNALLPEIKRGDSIELFQRLEAGWDDFSEKKQVMTFVDVMTLGNVQQKREALSKISRYFRREFAPALIKGLNDSSNSIRVQSATVFAKIEQQYMSAYMELTKRYHKYPQQKELLLKMAQQADAYAYSGILNEEREHEYRKLAITHYEEYLTFVKNDSKVWFALARLCLQENLPERAAELLKSCVEQDRFHSPNLGMWYLESLFTLGRLDEVREVAKVYINKGVYDSVHFRELFHKIELWCYGIEPSRLKLRFDQEKDLVEEAL